jgi:hypothetical protein
MRLFAMLEISVKRKSICYQQFYLQIVVILRVMLKIDYSNLACLPVAIGAARS